MADIPNETPKPKTTETTKKKPVAPQISVTTPTTTNGETPVKKNDNGGNDGFRWSQ